MKNKKSIYIMLPLVLLIWGAIIYQFFSYVNPESSEIPNQEFAIKPLIIKKIDSVKIKINPRDPFSGKLVDEMVKKRIVKQSSKKIVEIKEALVWPKINYKGIVSDNKDKIRVYMIIINNKTHLMKKGDFEEEILLIDGNRQAISLKYKRESKDVLIQ
ncbi:MAG: hypothetical protein H7239_01545 [Flavobacterium sp.]|nr:hypothetical protein [Flavobacterium sp.]